MAIEMERKGKEWGFTFYFSALTKANEEGHTPCSVQ